MKFFSFILSLLFLVNSTLAFEVKSNDVFDQAQTYFQKQDIITKDFNKTADQAILYIEFLKLALENNNYQPSPKIHLSPTPFPKVKANSWYAPYVQKAYRLGLISKDSDFNPTSRIRRIEVFDLLLKLEGYTVPLIYNTKLDYKDLRTDEEKRIVAKILELGVYQPKDKKIFGINALITKKEALELIYKFTLITETDIKVYAPTTTDIPQINIKIDNASSLKNLKYLESVKEQLYSKYYKPNELDENKLMDSAIEGYVKGVDDKYTVYFPPQESQDFNDVIQGNFEGIGAYLEETDEGIVVIAPIKNSPAEKAGVKAGDIIKKVDGKEVNKMPISDVVHLIKGPAGSEVTIDFKRGNEIVSIKIIRDKIVIEPILAEVKDNILIITMTSFNYQADIKFSDIINKEYNPNLKGIILDLRSNPGGFLDIAENMLAYWVPENEATVKLKYKDHEEVKTAMKNQKLTNVKTAILQNNSSASASEIVAGTLKDYGKAHIFGETSFGKGSVQEIIQYQNGSSLKVTVAEWLTGKGTVINGIGVITDTEIKDNKDTETDEVLAEAIKWINQ